MSFLLQKYKEFREKKPIICFNVFQRNNLKQEKFACLVIYL